jgi:hypothetical protein
MEATKSQYPELTFTKVGDVQTGVYRGYDQTNIQPGVSKLLFKLEKDGKVNYLPTEADLNKKLRMIEPNKTITITYTKDEPIGMAGTIKIFEII